MNNGTLPDCRLRKKENYFIWVVKVKVGGGKSASLGPAALKPRVVVSGGGGGSGRCGALLPSAPRSRRERCTVKKEDEDEERYDRSSMFS